MNHQTRRDFLKTLSAMSGSTWLEQLSVGGLSGLLLSAQRALAEPTSDPQARFLLIRVNGAMDSTLGLHPWLGTSQGIAPQDLFLGYSEEQKVLSQIEGTQISLGPSAAKISPFAKQMAIVRGVVVGANDLGHPFALQYMSSGRTQESAPSWTSYLGGQFAAPGTYVVSNSVMTRGNLKPYPILLTSVLRGQVEGLMRPTQPSLLHAYETAKDTGVARYLDLLKEKDKLAKFLEVYQASQALDMETYDSYKSQGKTDAEALQAGHGKSVLDEQIIIASLYSGLCRVAQLDIDVDDGGHLDTHVRHAETHLEAQSKRWDRIARILESLKNYALLENTLVVVVTEFNRTPGLNDNGGKDHNYADNAVALFGRGVNGGKVIGDHTLFKRDSGAAYAFWAGSFIDFAGSGAVVPTDKNAWLPEGGTHLIPKGFDLVRPGDIWASVINSLASNLVKELPDEAKVIPSLFIK